MEIQSNPFNITIKFDSMDFNSGVAHQFMDDMKAAIPYKARRFDPKNKEWLITNTKKYREKIEELEKKHTTSSQTDLFWQTFDVEEWLKQFDKPVETIL